MLTCQAMHQPELCTARRTRLRNMTQSDMTAPMLAACWPHLLPYCILISTSRQQAVDCSAVAILCGHEQRWVTLLEQEWQKHCLQQGQGNVKHLTQVPPGRHTWVCL